MTSTVLNVLYIRIEVSNFLSYVMRSSFLIYIYNLITFYNFIVHVFYMDDL